MPVFTLRLSPAGHPHRADWHELVSQLLWALVILMLSTVSRVQTSMDASFSLFWPSAGLGLALTARYGLKGLASVAIGVGLWAAWVMQWGTVAVVWAAVASTAGPALTWTLLRSRFAKVAYPFSSSDSLLAFMRVQILCGSVAAALLGSAGLWFTGHWTESVPFWLGTLAYWMIETTGALLFAPVAWSVLNPSRQVSSAGWPRQFAQALGREWRFGAAALALTGAVCLLLLANQVDFARALLYGLLPLLMVISLRASPLLVHVLILASGLLVLVTMAYLRMSSTVVEDRTQLLLASLYLLVGTATLHVLLATSSEKRRALERLERQAFVDAQTGLLNAAGLARTLETAISSGTDTASGQNVSLIGLTLSNVRQAASLTEAPVLQKLDNQLAEQLRQSLPEVRWAHVGTGRFQGVWVGHFGQLDSLLSKVRLLTVPLASSHGNASAPDLHTQNSFRPEWAVAAAKWNLASAQQDFSVSSMLSALAQAKAQAQQFRRVEVLEVDAGFMLKQQQDAAMGELVRQAINNLGFQLYAQPIVPNHHQAWADWHGETPKVRKFEVLVRMADSQGKMLLPDQFMPAAKNAGLMPQLDLAVVEQTIAWLAQHAYAREQIEGCAVNLSGPTVGDARTVDYIRNLFARYEVSPRILIFEITESLAVSDPEVAAQTLQSLRAMGSRVAIDDFGTGVATFDYLKRFEVDFIKIDGSFIRALQSDAIDRVIVESMVSVARCLGVRTVAEFVSSPELYALVSALGIDESQGYALATPKPIADWYRLPEPLDEGDVTKLVTA